jgi:tape measure domain-containing protein
MATSLRQLSNNLDPTMLMRTMRAFTATGFMTGADPEGLARAMVQYTQVANFGKLQGDELKLMQEAGVNLFPALQAAGLSGRLGSQTNPITFEELNAAILAFGESAEATQMMKEVSESGSAALARMNNIITQDLLPALGKEFTPVVKQLADNMPMLAGAVTKVIENWEWVGGGIATVWVGMKAAKMAEIVATISAARSLTALTAASNAAAASQGGGLLGGIFKKKPPKTAGTSVFKDTLGPGGLASALPSWGGAAGAGRRLQLRSRAAGTVRLGGHGRGYGRTRRAHGRRSLAARAGHAVLE